MSFQAVGPEEPKERSPKLAMQDRGTSNLFASAERNRGRPGTEVSLNEPIVDTQHPRDRFL